MPILIVNLDKYIGDADSWRAELAALLPEMEVRIWPDGGDPDDVDYLAFMRPDFGALPAFRNLKAMFTRSAGVDGFIDHPNLPKAPLCKVEPADGDPMMTEYVVMHVLRLHREVPAYRARQARKEWKRVPIVRPEARRIGFLGLGMMAATPASILTQLGFPVAAWTRSPKPDAEIPVYHGADQFAEFMGRTDIAVCLLPLTRETAWILNRETFALMPKGAMVINVGRGKHVVEKDLIEALDSGQLSYAALDALHPEPLPPESPLWLHPKVTVMPHVARRPTVKQIATEIARCIEAVEAGRPPLQQIDVAAGY